MNIRLLIFIFQKFNEIIDSFEVEVDVVEVNIMEIEWFISLVNNKLDEVIVNLGDVQELVEEVVLIVEEVGDIVN